MNGEGINYVIAAYFGPRGHIDPLYVSDPAVYMREHLAALHRLRHQLSQVTIVISGDSEHLSSLSIPSTIRSAKVVVLTRENVGFSYGSFSHAFASVGEKFAHHIFVEDDYVFTHDDFDSLLLEEIGNRSGCGMLCGAAWQHVKGDPRDVAAISVSIASTEVLKQAAATRNGALPYLRPPGYFPAYDSQIDFGFCIQDAGYSVQDWLARWASAFRCGHGTDLVIRWFSRSEPGNSNPYHFPGDISLRSFLVPTQCIDRPCAVDSGNQRFPAVIHTDGTLHQL